LAYPIAAVGLGLFLYALIPAFVRGWRYAFCDADALPMLNDAPIKGDALRLLCYLLLGSFVVYGTALLFTGSLNSLVQADALHYTEIAKNGYTNVGETRYFIVFFPLFPLCMRLLTYLLGDALFAAIVLNNGFLFVAMWYLYKMGCRVYGRKTALRSAKYLSLFPFALFFRNPYTESLFVMLSVMSIYYAMDGRHLTSGVMGLLCALCRSTGVILMLPILMESVRAWRMGQQKLWIAILATLLPLGGFAIYLGLNYAVTGNALQFLIYQREHWYNGFALFPHSLFETADYMLHNTQPSLAPFWVSQFLAIMVFSFLLAAGCKHLHPTHSAYALAGFFIMLSQDWLLSGGRYLMGIAIPFYIPALWAKKPMPDAAVTALCVMGLLYLSCVFCMGTPLY